MASKVNIKKLPNQGGRKQKPQSKPGPLKPKEVVRGSKRKLLGLTKAEGDALRNLVSKSHEKEHCALPGARHRIRVSHDPLSLRLAASFVIQQANDEIGFIPKDGTGVTPGKVLLYLNRVLAWYLRKTSGLDDMPAVNADGFVVPGWFALILRANAIYSKGESSVSWDVDGLDDASIDATTTPVGLLLSGTQDCVPVITSYSQGEPVFGQGMNLSGTTHEFGDVVALLSSLKDAVLVKDIPLTGTGEGFWDLQRGYLDCHPLCQSFRLFTAPTNTFRGQNGNTAGQYSMLLKGIWTKSQTMSDRLNSNGFKPAGSVRSHAANTSWVGLAVADFLVANHVTGPAFWAEWKAMYISVLVYLYSFAPYRCRNNLFAASSNVRAGYQTLSHRKVKVPSTFMAFQKPGYYVENGNLMWIDASPVAGNWSDFNNPAHVFSEYTGGTGNFYQQYAAGTADMSASYDLTPNPLFNALPINQLPEIQSFISGKGYSLFTNVDPKVAKCLCWGSIEATGDIEIITGPTDVEWRYRALTSISCDGEMGPITCCWMSAGTLAQHLSSSPMYALDYLLYLSNTGSLIRNLNLAAMLDPAKAVAVGQSRNVGESALKVTLDQFNGVSKAVTTVLSNAEVRSMVSDYLRQRGINLERPSVEQIYEVATGNPPLSVLLSVLAGGALHYGRAIYRGFNAVRVRDDL